MSCPTITKIQPTECIGNSLNTINNNYQALKTGVCDNQDQINTLRTLLYELSSNMMTLNVPYAQLIEPAGKVNPVSTLNAVTGATGSSSQPAQLLIAATPVNAMLTRDVDFTSTPSTYLDTIGIIKDGVSIGFPRTGVYEISLLGPTPSLRYYGASVAVDVVLVDNSTGNIIASSPGVIASSQANIGDNSSNLAINTRIRVTDITKRFTFKLRRHPGNAPAPVFAMFPDPATSNNPSTLFNLQVYRLGNS